MNINQINELKNTIPNCYPSFKDLDWDVFDDDFITWPTNPDKKIDASQLDRYRDRDPFSDFDDIEPRTRDLLDRDEESLRETSKKLKDILKVDEYPGCPSDGHSGASISPETLAFYLPYHHFSPSIWGIYLIAEGVVFLRDCLLLTSGNTFRLSEAERLAKAFLFYHETYHNKVESFSTKMEISHRSPFYMTGQLRLSKSPCHKDWFHEEALANHHAIISASNYFKTHIRARKNNNDKLEAQRALKEWVRTCTSSPYKDCLRIANKKRTEEHFLEQLHFESLNPGSKKPHQIWQGFNNALRGDLPRGSKCSYITPRNSPIVKKSKLGQTLFKTKKLKSFLEKRYPNILFKPSKVHQNVMQLNGRKSDLPINRDVDRHTAGKIINDLRLEDLSGRKYNFTTLRQDIQNN